MEKSQGVIGITRRHGPAPEFNCLWRAKLTIVAVKLKLWSVLFQIIPRMESRLIKV